MFLFILDSLGSTELLFILVMALVFFGPRKLPQLSRSLGKNLAEFRRASEDFKRTWEREVALEESNDVNTPARYDNYSMTGSEEEGNAVQEPPTEVVTADQTIARQTTSNTTAASVLSADAEDNTRPEAPRKQDWL